MQSLVEKLSTLRKEIKGAYLYNEENSHAMQCELGLQYHEAFFRLRVESLPPQPCGVLGVGYTPTFYAKLLTVGYSFKQIKIPLPSIFLFPKLTILLCTTS